MKDERRRTGVLFRLSYGSRWKQTRGCGIRDIHLAFLSRRTGVSGGHRTAPDRKPDKLFVDVCSLYWKLQTLVFEKGAAQTEARGESRLQDEAEDGIVDKLSARTHPRANSSLQFVDCAKCRCASARLKKGRAEDWGHTTYHQPAQCAPCSSSGL